MKMVDEESKSDVVKEAREHIANGIPVCGVGERLLSALCDEVEELRRRNATQEESITHLQSQQRVMKEAIEAAQTWIEKFKTLDHNAFHAFNQGFEWEKCNERTCQKAKALISQLRASLEPQPERRRVAAQETE